MIARGVVQSGDNVVVLASRLMNDARRWPELVALNNLVAPYVAEERRAGVLAPGDEVLYPTTAAPAPTVDAARLEARTYFRDFALTPGGDLAFDGGRLALDSGLENLKAAVARRLKVLVGSHPFHPEYGSRARLSIGEVLDDARLGIVTTDVVRAVRADPRVVTASCTATAEGDVVRVVLTVTPVPPGTIFTLEELLR